MIEERIQKKFSTEFSNDAFKEAFSKHIEKFFIKTFALHNVLKVLRNIIETVVIIYNQTNDPVLIQGMSSVLEAVVTTDTDEHFGVSNKEVVIVLNIANILIVKSAKAIDGLKRDQLLITSRGTLLIF